MTVSDLSKTSDLSRASGLSRTSGPGVPPRSVETAVAAERGERPPRYLFFWGNRPPRGGGAGTGCLSQWWEAAFTDGGHVFATAEHYMMAHKAWLFGDRETAGRILAAGHPGEAKKLGREVRGFDEAVWAEHRYGIVVRGNVAKFGAHPDLREFLLGTRDRVLVEASPYDRVWGIGLAADDARAASAATWRGLNLLGFALMDARDTLAAGAGVLPSGSGG
ncbi:NADAR family protein [Streptosporangium fragile]|uniref:NADAR family protein n=1 Tax=Streptosporangium fragile TaxID=46186 RepID=A0ABN3VZR0_9ACTN